MTDASPERTDDEQDEADFRDDALSELMTGALAAKQMVAMSVPGGGDSSLPAPPAWTPSDSAPKAEALDQASGLPAQIDSGPFAPVEAEIEDDADETDESDRESDAAVQRAEADTVPHPAAPHASLSAAMEELPESSDDIAAALDISTLDEDADEPAASISTESGVVVTPQHAKGAQLTGAYESIPVKVHSPASPEPSRMPWIIGGLALALAVGGAVAFMNGGQAAEAPAASSSAPDPAAPSPADPKPGSEPAPARAEPEPRATEAETATPEEVYSAAVKRYEEDASNDALLDMTLAACELQDGPDARAAFRKLVGSKVRSKAVLDCRELGIDLNAEGHGFTAAELAEQAQAAYDDGEAKEALELAKQSNRTERNQHALMLIVESHCQLDQSEAAQKMMRHIAKKNRASVAKACAEHGVELPE